MHRLHNCTLCGEHHEHRMVRGCSCALFSCSPLFSWSDPALPFSHLHQGRAKMQRDSFRQSHKGTTNISDKSLLSGQKWIFKGSRNHDIHFRFGTQFLMSSPVKAGKATKIMTKPVKKKSKSTSGLARSRSRCVANIWNTLNKMQARSDGEVLQLAGQESGGNCHLPGAAPCQSCL